MVVRHNLKDVLSTYAKSTSLSLPTCKENQLEIHYNGTDLLLTAYSGQEPPLPFAVSDVFLAGISDWRRLTAINEGCKTVYEATLDVTGSNFSFLPGDTIGVIPHNYMTEVDEIINHLGLSTQADLQYHLNVGRSKGAKVPLHLPVKSTLRHVLTHCCDIRSILKKLFILALSKHTKDDNERSILEYLCSKEGSTAYNTHILNQRFCILDLFSVFKSCKPPIEVLLANLPRLLPRPYSIVNSGLRSPNIIKICFSVIELDNNRKGLVTGWMEGLMNTGNDIEEKIRRLNITDDCGTNTVPIYLRKNMSGFIMPEDLEPPLILIGPGTGVSPFIGFLEERQYLKEKFVHKKMGDVWLFFGCRNPALDFIYEKEMKLFLNNGTLKNLSTSFSRIDNSGTKYIQEAMKKSGEKIVKLIKAGGLIFVCGDSTIMAAEVKETLISCLVEHGGMSSPEAETLLSDLQTGRRYLVDAWS